MTIHPTAILEDRVKIGDHSSVWDNVHIRHDTRIGDHCSIGEKTAIAYDVVIGNYVKINAAVYICTGVEIEDMCMISAGTVFTNDLHPRAMNLELSDLERSDPTEHTLHTRVKQGCTIGANATIGPGLTLGCFSMIGMGAVVTRDVPDQALVLGNPARIDGWVCVCGPRLISVAAPPTENTRVECEQCGRGHRWTGTELVLDAAA